MILGVNWHGIKATASDDASVFKLIRDLGMKRVRIDVALTADTNLTAAPRLRQIIAAFPGVRFLVMLQTGFAWGDRTDHGRYPGASVVDLYAQAYNRTLPFVEQFRTDPIDWEMGNEINLLQLSGGSPLFGKGWSPAEFDTPLMHDWAQVLCGMSDAIGRLRNAYRVPLRRVLNTTSTMFGFLDFMAEQGVQFEMIDYHLYGKFKDDLRQFWGGSRPPFDLFARLASYGKPFVFGEVNAGEIYDIDDPVAAAASLTRQLAQIRLDGRAEAAFVYELFDEPAKAPPENRFGLMADRGTMKPAVAALKALQ